MACASSLPDTAPQSPPPSPIRSPALLITELNTRRSPTEKPLLPRCCAAKVTFSVPTIFSAPAAEAGHACAATSTTAEQTEAARAAGMRMVDLRSGDKVRRTVDDSA